MKNPTLSTFTKAYLEHRAPDLKPKTLAEYRRLLDHDILPKLGGKRLQTLDPPALDRWYRALRKRAPIAANRALTLISSILQQAALWGIIGSNPARGIRRAREQGRRRYLTGDEIACLRASAAELGEIENRYILALLYTGARPGELQVALVGDFRGETLELRDSKVGRRTIYLSDQAQAVFRAAIGSRLAREAIFPEINPTAVWKRLRRRSGLTDARMYDLRHSFASRGVAAGLSLPVIGALLGHTQAQTTLRYAHLMTETGIQAAQAVAGKL